MSTSLAIETTKLSKRYGSSPDFALKDLTIAIEKGEVYGFLGPNGAGKSTTIRTLLNFIQPTSGSGSIFGKDIVKDAVEIRHSIGYLSGDFNAYEKMTGNQFLDYMAELHPSRHTTNNRKELSKLFQAPLTKRIGELSKGNRQKIGIIQAFMHQPKLLILDEPTNGLDPLMQEAFYDLINKHQSQGATVFVSSHNLTEVQKICDRVGIIRDGQLIQEATIASLALEAAQHFEVRFANPVTKKLLRTVKGVTDVAKEADSFRVKVQGSLSPFLGFLAKQQVTSLATKTLDLEEEFMRYYEQEAKK